MKLENLSEKFAVECEVADSPWKQAVGLSFSRKRRNMLFTFPFERSWEFWMLGMSYPIKIIFIDGKKRVIEVDEAEPLSLNPRTWKVYVPKKKCKYVLEIPADSKYARKSFRFSACQKAKLFVHKFEKGNRLKW